MRMHQSKLSTIGKRLFEVIEFDSNEELLAEVRKHSFGLWIIYASGTVIAALVLFAAMALILLLQNASSATTVSDSVQLTILVGSVVIGLFVLGATFIAGYLYRSNVILLTNEKLAQVLYKSLFNRKISQLSIGDVQDVTVVQNGIFARSFNFGTIVIETAGEQQNYTFTYAINPYESAKLIVGAHERNLEKYGN